MATWVKYEGDRDKTWYDIKLFDGRIFYLCYPNADAFHPFMEARIDEKDVEFIKLSEIHPMQLEECHDCAYKRTKHTGWCYMFEKYIVDCQKFKRIL